VEIDSDDLCYVVFTSGSTGAPKATAVRHGGWYNLLNWLTVEYGLDHESANLLVSSFGFDISQRSLMTPLFTGAPLHLLPSRSFDVGLAYRLVGELRVRTLHCAPSTLYLLVEREMAGGLDVLTGLRHVFIGGEPMSAARVAEWATREGNSCLLLHQYGVAECTDVASSHRMVDYESYAGGPMPAGRPVYNTEIHILDSDLMEVPTAVVGEICISGISVGAGYLNAGPEARSRFVTIERDGAEVRLYRTGDQGYATESGDLVIVGRLDHQVKIRGMRIDLGDVEHSVRGHQDVRDVVVVPVHSGKSDTHLVAMVIPATERFDERALRRDLLGALPRNMVPQEFIELEAFPLNPNGKIDRKTLEERLRSGTHLAGSGGR
jgi:non-ribosomal peptide synthetase component F